MEKYLFGEIRRYQPKASQKAVAGVTMNVPR
jgi:hypothetical protein